MKFAKLIILGTCLIGFYFSLVIFFTGARWISGAYRAIAMKEPHNGEKG